MKPGDFVVRNSYGGDVLFRVEGFRNESAIIKGTDYRLLADSPLDDLSIVENPELTGAAQKVKIKVTQTMERMQQQQLHQQMGWTERQEQQTPQSYFEVPGVVLHLDGDGGYMKKSMQLYSSMRVPAHGIHVHESRMAEMVYRLLPQIKPDIIVITGHDGVLKHRNQQSEQYNLNGYKNSQNFVNAVQVARDYDKSKDGLVVVAGACQSHYEALLHAGANFASSPGRILIHALDPVYIAIKASYTPFKETINLPEVINGTISGIDGVGGIETMGRYRVGLPRPKAQVQTDAYNSYNSYNGLNGYQVM
ncbi:sporulation peptidase YabG [Paenibacillus sp. GCM10012307]|uniref:Sporulation peptidase YabG n=1 Tax=Paenibacillus roseus TaxID=2798579 RepID=A0A934J1X6_9BACL|nr:sporulation peptidase YabG [Paenibacillus roseus]MBJ6361290.1 sporulation peptidase YabG [Paenibacillus roseus]